MFLSMLQATEIYYDPDPKATIIEEDREWVEGYFDLNEVRSGVAAVATAGACAFSAATPVLRPPPV